MPTESRGPQRGRGFVLLNKPCWEGGCVTKQLQWKWVSFSRVRWHISANAKPKEKLVQHYKTRAHHSKKHKSIFRLHVQHFKRQVQHFPKCTCRVQMLLCFLKWCACVSTDAMHSISKAPSDPTANGVTWVWSCNGITFPRGGRGMEWYSFHKEMMQDAV